MGAPVLDMTSSMFCPHMGKASPISASPRVRILGNPILTLPSTLTVASCPFTTGSSPAPCLQITWTSASLRVRSAGQPVLMQGAQSTSVGAAGPQGPAKIMVVQPRVKIS